MKMTRNISRSVALWVTGVFIALAGAVSAATVTENEARAAASAFIVADPVGSAVLRGRMVSFVYERDGLWIAALSPSGHVILSGSDLGDPIVGFSTNDFAEPEPDSPAYAYLAGISASLAAQESNGGVRHARWERLLGSGTNPKLMAADIESPATVVIPPFLQPHYNQWQPYNDYAPVYESSTNNLNEYRGRCPCGCVATATAQGFRHFRWPARMDRVDSFNHSFTDANNVETTFPIRFDGHLPIDWTALCDDYDSDAGGEWVPHPDKPGWQVWQAFTDLRGVMPEAVRYPIARLVMFADVLAHMTFEIDGSGANYGTVGANATDWYTLGTWVSPTDARVPADIANGVPVQVRIPGHAVVGHGWATDGGNSYIYLNYGWGGSNDGYYNISGEIVEAYVGHYPRAKPQIDPLPKVCGTNLTLDWHFPDFYTNNLSGFTVSISRTATTPTTFLDDFSASSGVPSSSAIYVGTDSNGYDGNLLYTTAGSAGTFAFPDAYTLTSASVLSFKCLGYYTIGAVYEVQASFNGGDWETICAPSLPETGNGGWGAERIYLGGHGGESVRFRIRNSRSGNSYYSVGKILLDDFMVTDVLAPVAPQTLTVGKTARSASLSGFTGGATYSFTVTPNISGALVDGEASESVSTSIAGTRNTPIPGEMTYNLSTLSFSASDTSDTWSYSGTAVDDTSVGDGRNCSITCSALGSLTSTSTLTFDWTADDLYGIYNGTDSYDVLTATFKAADGTESPLWCITNREAKTSRQQVSCNLATLSGQSGKIVISYSHKGYGYGYGGVIYAPRVANILVSSVPAVAWNTETLTALGMPEIRSVSSVSEGFYSECGLGTTTFSVTCSENVTSLQALPSHLALVSDNDVTVTSRGNGRFSVSVRPSGITEDNLRSRMILTLAATDTNGTTVYKDLSLRFAPMEGVAAVTVTAQSASGAELTAVIPYTWFVENGLVSNGAADAAFQQAAYADSDGDGMANWAEYVCQTSPCDADEKLVCSIEVVDGKGKVSYRPSNIRPGYRAVVKGTDDLRATEWTTVTTETSTLHFFKVVIEME